MDVLKHAVHTYAARHANRDGLALTPVPGLRMMCVESPLGDLHRSIGLWSVWFCRVPNS